ncbi:metallo-dependent hydrolase [Geosporobacter ferrireducens]|uniref:metallo-dependent hydrolase n=1 Tax=Geosporobacter ferrireducens TaxID=1424294 RepID=UPI00139CDFB0|nr:metallo-dependent hydrolase [Geosporobacter ferrireducens]MTI54482.1 metallo-dependent hydrolase [Geosporobacter ferrireducens]
MDIIIKNGRVIDPCNKIDKVADIAVKDGKIAGIGSFGNMEGEKILDAKGCIVTPGLIDYHVHIYPLTEIGIPAEATCFSSGITTVVDAGSCGCANYEYYRGFINSSKLRIKCYLNVCSAGLVTGSYHENVNPAYFNRKKIKRLFEKYRGELTSLKVRLSKDVVGDLGIEPLKETIKLAEDIGVNVVVHSTDVPVTMTELVNCLRKGDVVTHAYHNIGHSIIDENGKVYDEIKAARQRGVIFDVANARFHFAFKIADAAIKDGFLPDVISTDLTVKSLYKKPQIFNMMFLLSKYLNMGLSMNEIIERCTSAPARIIGMEGEIGCLSPGSCADIAILKIIEKEELFEDWEGGRMIGKQLLRNMLTVRDGEVVYRDIEF